MAEETEVFNPLDSLGPEFGKINRPVLDTQGLSPFEGKMPRPQAINFPDVYYPAYPQPKADLPNRAIRENVVGNQPNPPGPSKKASPKDFGDSYEAYINSLYQANQDKNVYSKIYSYDAGPSGNAFYKRYAAYGQKTFDKVGFHPLRNNEANFNAATTWWDDANRMLTHSFVPLLKNGFWSGPKSLAKMIQGDFTSADLEDARMYEEAAAIGQSTKGGFGSFFNNTLMNFGYTAGIIGEAVVEEIAGAVLAPVTGGSSFMFATANNVNKASKIFRGFGMITDGAKALRQSLKTFSNLPEARKFWEAADAGLRSKMGRVLNPLENTMDALGGLSKVDNLTNLAKISKTAGGFYRDVRNLNMALSEARLEAGMVENKVFDELYNKHYEATGVAPTDKDEYEFKKQAKEASLSTLYLNTGLIYISNKITFDGITSPRGGIRNYLKSVTDDIARYESGKFGKLGKVVYDKTKKAFAFEKNNLKNLAKSWYRDPLSKSALGTIKYFKANFTEGIQENLQEVIAGANERYYIDTFGSDARSSYEYSKAAIKDGLVRQKGDYFREELGKQISGQGFETFASGFLMGTFAAPLNSAVPFLSIQYNRIFDKEAYTKWKESKSKIAEGLVKQLNDVNIGEFLSDRVYNLGAQDIAAQIKRTGTKKEALDAENQAFVDSVSLMMETGTIDQFKDKLGSFKEMTDEEFMDAMGGIAQEEVPKYRARIDQSIQKLDSVKAKKKEYTAKYPNPINAMSLDENDPDYYSKALTYHAWNKAVNNAVYFNETFEDVKSRLASIKTKYSQGKGFNVVNATDATAIFKPDALGNQIGLFETELAAEKASLKPNAKRIKSLEDKIASLQSYSEAYEGFNRFFSRGQYAGEIIAELKKELGTEPTQEQILERMDQKLGSISDENLALPYIKALKDSHHKYLKTLGLEQDEILFDEDLDAGFEQLLDFYKLNDEYKEVAKYVEALNNPENFLDLVQRNSEWMDKLYHNREEYYTKMILDQITKVEMNSLLNALADKGYFISAEDFENYVTEGTPPTEIFYAVTNKVYKRGTEEYNQVYREYFVKMAELRETVTKTKSEFVNKDYQSRMDKLDADMKADIEALPKDPETGMPDPKEVEKITNKYNKEKQRVEEKFKKDKAAAADEEKTDYTFTFEGKTVSTKDKSIKDLRVYQELIADRIKVLQESKDMSEDAEEKKQLTEQIKKFNLEIANIEKIIDAMTLKDYTAEQKKAIKAIQNLIKQQEGVEEGYMLTEDDPTTGLKKGDIAYRIKGLIHRRVTNAIRDVESKEYTYKSAPTIDTIFNKTIGKDGLNKTSAMNFMAQIRAEELDGFNSELYDELEQFVESLEGKSKAQIDQELYIDKINKNLAKLDEKIAAAYADDNSKRAALLTKQKQDLEVELEQAQSPSNTKLAEDIVKNRLNIDYDTVVWDDATGSKKYLKGTSDIIDYNGRKIVVLSVNGINVPFYLSTGSGGKVDVTSGKWYPIFGISDEGWLNKLSGKEINDYYGSPILKALSQELDIKIGDIREWDVPKVPGKGNHIDNFINKDLTPIDNGLPNTRIVVEQNINKVKSIVDQLATTEETASADTTLDLIQKFAAERSYEDGRTVGNFVDDAKDYFEKGIKPEFDEKIITREAYDNLFGETGYLTELKRKVDSREVYIVGRGLVVYDSDITKPDGSKDRIAGEIDLIMADRKGNIFIVDLKTGTQTKWNNFNKFNRTPKDKNFSKRENYTLQQGAYARMLENMIGIKAKVALLPVQRVTNKETNQIIKAGKPTTDSIYKQLIFSKDANGNYLRTPVGDVAFEIDESETKSSMFIPLYPDVYKEQLDQILPLKKKAAPTRPLADDEIEEEFDWDEGDDASGIPPSDIEELETPTEQTISNGDKIINVNYRPFTDQIKSTEGELFLTSDRDPNGKIYINTAPLKNILVVPNNTLTIIDKTTGKEIINKELNPEGSVIFEAMQGRLFVVANINGQLVPFYKSSSGTSGKNQGDWYPFFGYTGNWLVKGGIDKATGKMSYSSEIDRVEKLLNENLIFPDKYINRATNTVKDVDGNTMFDFNDFFKVNRLWQKVDGLSTGNKTNYSIKGLKENTRSESGAVALVTGLNTTQLDSSDTPKENDEWLKLILTNAKAKQTKASAYENIINKYRNTEEAAKKTIEDLKASLIPLTNTVSFANIDLDENSPFIIEELKKDSAFAERFAFHERIAESTSSQTTSQEEAVDVLKQSGIVTAAEVKSLAPTMGAYSELIHEAVKRIQYLKTQSTDNTEIKALSDYQRQIFTLMSNTKFLGETQNFIDTIESINFEATNGRPRTAIKQANQVISELTTKEQSKYTRTDEKKRLQIKIEDLKLLRDDIIAKEGLEGKLDDPTTVAELTKEISTAMDIEKARKLLKEAINNDLIITSEGINSLNSLLAQREQEIANNELPTMDETNIQEGDIYIAKTNIFTSEKQKNPYIKEGGKVRVISYNAETNTVKLVKDGGKKPKPYEVSLDQFNEQYMLKDVLDAAGDNATTYKPTKDEKDLAKYSTEVLGDFLKDSNATAAAKAAAEKQSAEDIDNELLDNLTCK